LGGGKKVKVVKAADDLLAGGTGHVVTQSDKKWELTPSASDGDIEHLLTLGRIKFSPYAESQKVRQKMGQAFYNYWQSIETGRTAKLADDWFFRDDLFPAALEKLDERGAFATVPPDMVDEVVRVITEGDEQDAIDLAIKLAEGGTPPPEKKVSAPKHWSEITSNAKELTKATKLATKPAAPATPFKISKAVGPRAPSPSTPPHQTERGAPRRPHY